MNDIVADPAAYTPVLGAGEFAGEKPVHPTLDGPFVYKAIRLQQDGDCVTMGAFAWENTYFGDFLSLNPSLAATASWNHGRYWTIQNTAPSTTWTVTFTGWNLAQGNNPSVLTNTGDNHFSFCMANGGTQLLMTFGSPANTFATLNLAPANAGDPLYIDLAIDNPSAGYRFPFDLMSFHWTDLNLPILVAKSTQDCTTGNTLIGELRNTGECIYIDMTQEEGGFFAIGDFIGGTVSAFSEKKCVNYLNQKAIIWDGANKNIIICPGWPMTAPACSETVCAFCSCGQETIFSMPDLLKLTFCKTDCGFNLTIDGDDCHVTQPFSTSGDFILHGVSATLCPDYQGPGSVGVFKSSCPGQPEFTLSPTTQHPTSPTRKPTRTPTLTPTRPTKKPTTPKPTHIPSHQPSHKPTRKP